VPDRLLSKKDVADRYGIHPKTVEAYAAAGRIPKPVPWQTKERKWLESDIDRHLAAMSTNPAPVAGQQQGGGR
jgi:predicted DNA-binding transcriptional regulator AlpA